MILVTGALGFVGRRLLRRLAAQPELKVRVLLRPGTDVDRLPRGVSVHVVMAELDDTDALVAAMDGVHTIYHLIGTESRGRHAQLQGVDVRGMRSVLAAALTARVGRIIAVSRVGADRASAYPGLRSKGEIEDAIRKSGLAYTIIQTGVLFGEGDHFSENIAMLVRSFPFFLVANDGEQVLQPLWVEDLVTCLTIALQNLNMIDETISLGGPEIIAYRRIVMRIMYAIGSQRPIFSVPILVLRAAAWFFDGLFARWPFSEYWIELLSTNQTAELGNIERLFGFRPAALDIGLIDKYMTDRRYGLEFLRYIFTTRW